MGRLAEEMVDIGCNTSPLGGTPNGRRDMDYIGCLESESRTPIMDGLLSHGSLPCQGVCLALVLSRVNERDLMWK